jgi:hypothetical protein
MAIEFREHHERLQAAIKKQATGVGELIRSLCPADATPLDRNGTCRVCHKTFNFPPKVLDPTKEANAWNGHRNTPAHPRYTPTDTDDTPPKKKEANPEPKATWPDGTPRVVGEAQAAAQAEFWAGHNRRIQEREQQASDREEQAEPRQTIGRRFLENPALYLRH